jgi:thioredoxin 1
MSTITNIAGKDLENIIGSNPSVLVNFSAPWCGPCKTMQPALEAFGEAHPEVKIVKINIDEDFELASAYGIRAVPTMVLIKDTQVAKTTTGAQSKSQLEKLLG